MPERKHYFMLKVIHKIKSKQKTLRFIPVLSGVALVGVLGFAGSAFAETNTPVDLKLNIAETGVSVSVSKSTASISLVPTKQESFVDTGTDMVTVIASSQGTGHKLVMYGGTNLISESNSSNQINTIASTCTKEASCALNNSSFAVNKWGYNVDSNAEGGFRVFGGYDVIKDSEASTTSSTNVTFGAKINTDQPAGTYTNTLYFAVVSNVMNYIMQDMTLDDCTTAGLTVKDIRDNNTYAVKKLADGKCWMLDNLALDPTDTDVKAAINEYNTNASAESLAAFKNGGGSSPLATEAVTATWGANETIAGDASTRPEGWTDNWTVPRVNTAYIDTVLGGHTNGSVNSSINTTEKVGVYYNYCAASAGSYCHAAGAGVANASQDICPAGWRLPTGNTGGKYSALYAATDIAGDYAKFVNALELSLSGFLLSGSAIGQGSEGYWWSSTRGGVFVMYFLSIDASSVYPNASGRRWSGLSIRCVLD